jgi:hypothetical protein
MVKRSSRSFGRWLPLALCLGAACNAIVGIDDPIIVEAGGECDEDADCRPGARCLATRGGSGVCLGGDDARCDDEGDCPGVAICSNGECRIDCSADPSSCLSDQVCGEDGVCRGTDPARDPVGGGGSSGGGAGKGGTSAGGKGGKGGAPARGGAGGSSGEEVGGAGATGAGAVSGRGGEGGSEQAGGNAGGGGAECEVEGHVGCAGEASPERLRCESGRLVPYTACPDGELCDNGSEPSGECLPVPPECVGREPLETFCEGNVRTGCGPDLVSVESTECASNVLCMLGTGLRCGACVTDEYRCSGELLEVCNSNHTGFDPLQTCTTQPCNEDAGACTSYACNTNDLRCHGDDLERCNGDRSAYMLEEACGDGLCDPVGLECDECPAGRTRCVDATQRAECAADGQGEVTALCPAARSHCVGAGQCLECLSASDCTASGPCFDARCNSGTGTCEQVARLTGDACDRDGNGSTDGFCSATRACVDCVQASQCVTSNQCLNGACSPAGQCNFPPRSVNVSCGSGDFCDGGGNCVECNNASQCGADAQCAHPRCMANACSVAFESPGVACNTMGGRACNGSGACVPCVGSGQAQCGTAQVCRSQACVTALHSVGWEAAVVTTASVAAEVLYLKRLPVFAHAALLKSFGVIGAGTGATARMALYTDNATGPGPTGSTRAEATLGLVNGAREIDATPANVMLQAGVQYWLGIKVNVAATLRAGSATPAGEQLTDAYTNPFPTFTGVNLPSSYATELAIYIRVQDTD